MFLIIIKIIQLQNDAVGVMSLQWHAISMEWVSVTANVSYDGDFTT